MKYKNPVISGFYPDPSVVRVGDDFYLVTSTFEYFPGVPIFHSKNLVNWTQIGHCLTRKSQLDLTKIPCSGGIFAPTIRYHDGIFYMVTTNVHGGGNFYVYTTDPAGEWSDPIWLDQGEKLSFDPSFLFDDDKVYYHRREGESIVQAEIDIKTGKLLTDIKKIDIGRCSPDIEGPHLYKINDWYYLMCAEGGTRKGHMETIARSKNPYGPFERYPHNPILTQRDLTDAFIRDTGHAELIEDASGNWWVMFLGTRQYNYDGFTTLGRETFLASVTWQDGWPIVNNDKRIKTDMVVDNIDIKVSERKSVFIPQDFDTEIIPMEFNYVRNPVEVNYSLTERTGWLALKGSEVCLDDNDAVTFLGRRQQHFNCKASTLLDFSPNHDNEEAGIVAFMNSVQYYALGIKKYNDKRRLFVRRCMEDLSVEVASITIDDGNVELIIEADKDKYSFYYSIKGEDQKLAATAMCKYLASEITDGFTGVYLGMYATGNGKKSTSTAYFDYFNYWGNDVK